MRKVTAEVLESAGYTLVIAGDAEEALAHRGRLAPLDLLLADMIMPGMSGRELAVELTRFYPSTRVPPMSGYADQLAAMNLSVWRRVYAQAFFDPHAAAPGARRVGPTGRLGRTG